MASKLSRISKNHMTWARGEEINFLAQGHKIKHAGETRYPNVVFAEVEIDKTLFPKSYLSYIPSHYYNPEHGYRAMGVFSITDIQDNNELFVNYWDNYDIDKDVKPEWLTIPQSPLEDLFFIKKGYVNDVSYLSRKALETYMPREIRERNDIEIAVNKKLHQTTNAANQIEGEETKKLDK